MTDERLKIIRAAGCGYCMELIDWTEKLEAKETPEVRRLQSHKLELGIENQILHKSVKETLENLMAASTALREAACGLTADHIDEVIARVAADNQYPSV